MRFERDLAVRYLKSRRRYGFVSATVLLSGAGIALGVMAMLVTLSVMDGFEQDLKEKLLGNTAPITITGKHLKEEVQLIQERLGDIGEIRGLFPYVRTQVLLVSDSVRVGVTLLGIRPEGISLVRHLPEQMVEGDLGSLSGRTLPSGHLPEECEGKPRILLGRELTNRLGCFYGDLIQVVSPVGVDTPFGFIPVRRSFCVGGVFQTGLYEYDASFAYVGIGVAQEFLHLGSEISGVEVGLAEQADARQIAGEIRERLGERYRVEDWTEQNRRLFSAMRLEKIVAFLVLALIVFVAVLNILSSLAMTVIEKRREIAVLRALGATRWRVQRLFMLQGMLIGLAGTGAGVVLALTACSLLSRYPIVTLPREVFYQFTLPVRMEPVDFVSVSLAALLLSFVATLYPAWKAARVPPAETLRHE